MKNILKKKSLFNEGNLLILITIVNMYSFINIGSLNRYSSSFTLVILLMLTLVFTVKRPLKFTKHWRLPWFYLLILIITYINNAPMGSAIAFITSIQMMIVFSSFKIDRKTRVIISFALIGILLIWIFRVNILNYYAYFKANWKKTKLINPNAIGTLILFGSIMLNSIFVNYSRTKNGKLSTLIFSILIFIITFFTLFKLQSRASLIALLCYAGFIVVQVFFKSSKITKISLIIAFVLILIFPFFMTFLYQQSMGEVGLTNQIALTSKSLFSGRERIWTQFINESASNPMKLVFGFGSGHFDTNGMSMHNLYLQIVVNFGLVGLVSYIVICKNIINSKILQIERSNYDIFEIMINSTYVVLIVLSTFETNLITISQLTISYMVIMPFKNYKDDLVILNSEASKNVLIVGRGMPTDKYPMNGLFEWNQAIDISETEGLNVYYLGMDFRSIRRWRQWKPELKTYKESNLNYVIMSVPLGKVPIWIQEKIGAFILESYLKEMKKSNVNFEIIHAHFLIAGLAIAQLDQKLYPMKKVYTEHQSIVINPLYIDSGKYSKQLEYIYNNISNVVAVSPYLSDIILERFGIKSIYIPNYVSEDFKDLSKYEIKNSTVKLLSVGGLTKNKGMDLLVEAVLDIPDVELTIVGEGPLKSDLIAKTENSNISIVGGKRGDELLDYFASSSVFILISEYETFGLAYAEALVSGLPVIASSCGGPDYFFNSENSVLVEREIESIKFGIYNMINKLDTYDRNSISIEAYNHFSKDLVINKIVNLYLQEGERNEN